MAQMSAEKEMFGFRANEPLADSIKEYMDAQGLNESDALRELVQKGLEYDGMADRFEQLEARVAALEDSR